MTTSIAAAILASIAGELPVAALVNTAHEEAVMLVPAPAVEHTVLHSQEEAAPKPEAETTPVTGTTRRVTGIRKVEMSPEDAAFSLAYRQELKARHAQIGRPLDQLERVGCYAELKKERGETVPTSKMAILMGALAAYHRWPAHMCLLTDQRTRYTYNSGLRSERQYREIEPKVQAWLNA